MYAIRSYYVDLQRLGNGLRHVVLDIEYVGHLPVVGLRPDVETVVGFDQLRGNAQALAGAAHRSFQNICHAQRVITSYSIHYTKLYDTIPLFNLTAKFSATPGDITAPPPRISEHTEEVLAGIGITAEEVAILKEQGVV